MIKGVTKNIIEVNNPESIYFEKAVFYLRPEIKELPPEISEKEVNRYITSFGSRYGRKRRSVQIFKGVLYSLLFAVLCLIVAVLAYYP